MFFWLRNFGFLYKYDFNGVFGKFWSCFPSPAYAKNQHYMQHRTPSKAIDEKLFESLLFLFVLLYTEARYAHTLRTFPDYSSAYRLNHSRLLHITCINGETINELGKYNMANLFTNIHKIILKVIFNKFFHIQQFTSPVKWKDFR